MNEVMWVICSCSSQVLFCTVSGLMWLDYCFFFLLLNLWNQETNNTQQKQTNGKIIPIQNLPSMSNEAVKIAQFCYYQFICFHYQLNWESYIILEGEAFWLLFFSAIVMVLEMFRLVQNNLWPNLIPRNFAF